MKPQIVVTQTEIYAPDNELLAKITMFDEGGSEVDLKQSIQCPESWRELSAAILKALKQMHKEPK